uniref:BHLH domain-containing protein n=1 Tax=Ciona savignyi TaxID=51511 RepID=H2ZAW9_CIOSA
QANSRKRRSDTDVTRESKRRRSNCGKERDRLSVFNQALEALQGVIPIRLTEQRKLHKKQTLQLAIRYINFLRGCLDGSRDWDDRSRFWCQSQDEMIITAIDQAAAPHITSSDVLLSEITSQPMTSSATTQQQVTYTVDTSQHMTSHVNTSNDVEPAKETYFNQPITSLPQHSQLQHQNMTSQLHSDVIHPTQSEFLDDPNHDAAYLQYDPTASFLTSYFQKNDVTHSNIFQPMTQSSEYDFTASANDVSPPTYDLNSINDVTNHSNDVIYNQSTTDSAFADLEAILSSPENNCFLPGSPESGYNS